MKQRKLQEELTKLQKTDVLSKKYDKTKRARKSDQPLARRTTTTETETVDVEDLRNESCTQEQNVSSPNTRRRLQTIESSVTVVTSKSVASTSERSNDSTSTETSDADMKEDSSVNCCS